MVWGVVVASVSWAAGYFPASFVFWAYGDISGHNILGDWIGYLVLPLTYSSTALLEAIEKRLMVFHGLLVKTLCPKAILVRVTLGVIKVLQWHWIQLKQGGERVIGFLHKKSSVPTDTAPPWPHPEKNRKIVLSGFVLQGLWFLSISSFMWTTYSHHALVRFY
jgi:hypothetical protein